MTPDDLAATKRRYAAALQVVRRDKHLSEAERLDLLDFVVAPPAAVQLAEELEVERQKRLQAVRRGRRAA